VAHQHGELLRSILSEHPGARQAWADRLAISRQALDDLIESERLYEGDVALLPPTVVLAYLDAIRDLHAATEASQVTRLQAVTDAHRECSEAVTVALSATARGSTVSRETQRREILEGRAALDRLLAVVEASP